MDQFAVAFSPDWGSTITIAPTATSQRQEYLSDSRTIRVYNESVKTVFVRFDNNPLVVATPQDLPVSPGAVEIFHGLNPVANYVAAVYRSGDVDPAGKVHFTRGFGA